VTFFGCMAALWMVCAFVYAFADIPRADFAFLASLLCWVLHNQGRER
jgi:hypothetical protein